MSREIRVEDILEVRSDLHRTGIPLEVVDKVMDYAEYWYKQNFSRRTNLKISCGRTVEVSTLYILTPPIGCHADLARFGASRPRRIEFRISSHDDDMQYNDNVKTFLKQEH